MEPSGDVKLTQYSHGAGCGCKIAPAVLHDMLSGMKAGPHYPQLLVGNDTKDDAAVVDLGDGTAIVSTTDFFMPIVDDPHTFGRIAAANAISDIYAMGGAPLVAIAIFGWPIDKLDETVAGQVLEGGRSICEEAGIPLAGGHSIDCPEPIFGLAVTGRVSVDHLQKNAAAHPGDVLFLTKPLGLAPHQAEGLSLHLGGPSTDRDKKSENYSWSSRVRSHAATRCLACRTASGVISRSLATVWDASPARPCRSKAVRVLPSNWPRACRIRSMTYS